MRVQDTARSGERPGPWARGGRILQGPAQIAAHFCCQTKARAAVGQHRSIPSLHCFVARGVQFGPPLGCRTAVFQYAQSVPNPSGIFPARKGARDPCLSPRGYGRPHESDSPGSCQSLPLADRAPARARIADARANGETLGCAPAAGSAALAVGAHMAEPPLGYGLIPSARKPRAASSRHRSPKLKRQLRLSVRCTRFPSARSSAGRSPIGASHPARCQAAQCRPCNVCQRLNISPQASSAASPGG
jgi:hypothetical protein